MELHDPSGLSNFISDLVITGVYYSKSIFSRFTIKTVSKLLNAPIYSI